MALTEKQRANRMDEQNRVAEAAAALAVKKIADRGARPDDATLRTMLYWSDDMGRYMLEYLRLHYSITPKRRAK